MCNAELVNYENTAPVGNAVPDDPKNNSEFVMRNAELMTGCARTQLYFLR